METSERSAADDIVCFNRQHLLQNMTRAVCLKRPNLHLPESLASHLRLTAERLLCNE